MDTILHDRSIYEGLPEMGADCQGWHSDHELFKRLLLQVNPEVIIEVGSWKGASAIGMLTKCDQIGEEQGRVYKPHLFCVDTWLGSPEIWKIAAYREANPRPHGYPRIYHQFLNNVRRSGYQDQVTPLPMTSRQGAGLLSDHGVMAKLIYIDASHDYVDVAEDLKLYWNLLAPGGTMFGDDWGFFGVRVAVEEFAHLREMEPSICDNNFWVLRKAK